ncbi:hypothetical protein CPT_MarsHill_226 [Staphylococcus phage MarsHill]|nr:hypothetical protein CPT_MarsHill_226 [Staphylococcus phage MarsHill]
MNKLNLDNIEDLSLMVKKLRPEIKESANEFRMISELEKIFIQYNLKNRILEKSSEFNMCEFIEILYGQHDKDNVFNFFVNFKDFLDYEEDIDIYGLIEINVFDNRSLKEEMDIQELDDFMVQGKAYIISESFNFIDKKVPMYFGDFYIGENDMMKNLNFMKDIYSEVMMTINDEDLL